MDGISERDIEICIGRMRNLAPLRHLSNADLRARAIAKLQSKQEQKPVGMVVDADVMFSDVEEGSAARILIDKYLRDYSIETVSERNTLQQIVYLEVIQRRLQGKLNEYYKQDSKAQPLQLLEAIHKNSKAISELKGTLGLNKSKEQRKGAYDVVQDLRKRFKHWMSENQGSRTLFCPHCGKMILLRIRTAAWEALKHPFFVDRIIANTHLTKMYKDGVKFSMWAQAHQMHEYKILGDTVRCNCGDSIKLPIVTKADYAEVIDTSPDYIDWMLSKLAPNTEGTPLPK